MAEWTKSQVEYLYYFLHPAKSLGGYIDVPEDIQSVLWGLSSEEADKLDAAADSALEEKVDQLLADESFKQQVADLPFTDGEVVAGFGDSITDYSMSWFELLRVAYRRIHGPGKVTFHNLAISGDTTADLIRRMLEVVVLEPSWIITMAGTNDAKLFLGEKARTFASPEESSRNLSLLSDTLKRRTNAQLVWMTPPPVVEAMISESWLLQEVESVWLNSNIEPLISAVKQLEGTVVDLEGAFGDPPDPGLFLEDGLHPSIEGESVILRHLIQTLTRSTP